MIAKKFFVYCYYNVLTVIWILFGFNYGDNSGSSRRIYLPKDAPHGYVALDLGQRYGQSTLDFGPSSAFLQNFFALDERGTKIIVIETLTKLWTHYLLTRFTSDLIIKTSLLDGNFVVRVQKLEFRLLNINDENFQFAEENSLILRTKANRPLSTIEIDFCVDYSTYNALDIVQYGSKIVRNTKFYFFDVKNEFLNRNLIITAKNELENVATESIVRSISNSSSNMISDRTCDKVLLYIPPNNRPGRTFFDIRNSKLYNLSNHDFLVFSIKSYRDFPIEIDPFTGQLFNVDHLKPNLHIDFDIIVEKSCGGFSGNGHVIDFLTIKVELFVFETLGKLNSPKCYKRTGNRYKRDLKPDILLNVPENYPIGTMLKDMIGLSKNERVKDAPLDKKMFTIFENGSILLKSQLNYELESAVQFVVLIHNSATMQDTPQRISINVIDIDEKPKFVNQPVPFLAVVQPDVPVGLTVYQFFARDEEGDGDSDVDFKLISTEPSDSFMIDSKTGRVKTARTNYEPGRTYLVYVQAHDRTWQNSTSRVSDVAKLDIKVGQRPPQFFQESYRASVAEDLPVAASVAQVKAMSFMNNPDHPIRFSLFEDNPNNNFENSHALSKNSRSDAFSMDEETGVVHLAKNLDFDDQRESKSYKLTVVADEGGLKSSVPLEITVKDVNDNDPYFTQPLYTATINEDHPIGQKILRIVAKDKDSGRNADITYHLDNGNFTVDKRGYVSPKIRLDADQKQLGVFIYRFSATATDNGDPPRSAASQIQIKTLNVNDEAPFFVPTSLYTDYVAEDAQGNTPILYVQAQDPDRDQVKYAFLNERNEQVTSIRHFDIDRDTGLVKLREGIEPIHLKEQDSYEMKVIAIDDSSCCLPKKNIVHSSVAKVKIGVKDINNNKPVFHDCDKYSKLARVPEGKHQHLLIIKVEATDNDSGQNGDIVYSLYYPGGDNRRPFTINATSGEVWASPFVEFDREERAFEDVTVKAKDKGNRPLIGFCHFTVTVDDENDNSPEFNRAAYEGSVSRSTPIGQSIVTVFADDRDGPSNSQITYSLKADPNEPDHEQDSTYFRINDKGGEIVLTNVVPAQRQKMVFLVVATDNGQVPRNSQAKVTIDVAEAAKHYPVWLSHPKCPNEVTVDEDVQINHVFFECYAVSGTAESNPISYSMRNGQKPNANSNGDFREFQTKKKGKDYVIIRNLKPLDHEKINKYELTISAKDMRNGLSKDKTVYIKVNDKNDNVPKFSSDQFTGQIEEEKEVNVFQDKPIVVVAARDNDHKAEFRDITYEILPSAASPMFRIDRKTGAVYATQSFDREMNDSFILDVQAEDGAPSDLPGATGPNKDLTKVHIIIQDINDNAPYFNETFYRGRVRENAERQQNVMTVKAHDLDKNSELRYSLDQRGNEDNAFGVYPNSGTIFVSSPLDYEKKKRYNLTLYVTDGTQSHQASTRIEIEIDDVNDNAPQFQLNQYSAELQEEDRNTPKLLLQVKATDKDEDASSKGIVYRLVGQGANKEFIINNSTGEIFAAEPLNRDPPNGIDRWNLVVQAIDDYGRGLVGYADVQVLLTDINDNAPVFAAGPIVGYIMENQDITDSTGVYVKTMTASDNDDPRSPNSKLTYDIQRNKYFGDRPAFRIESQTGKVFALMKFDRENISQKEFEIQIKATDQGTPPLSGIGSLMIKVMDVNDNPPFFDVPFFTASVKETAPIHSAFFSLSAKDPDTEAKDNILHYSIVGGGDSNNNGNGNGNNASNVVVAGGANFFYMTTEQDHSGSMVGIVRVKQPLDYENVNQRYGFNVTINVTDGRHWSTGRLRIKLLDQNDNAPRFLDPQSMVVRVVEEANVGQKVHHFRAYDPDFEGKDQFYVLLRDDLDIFLRQRVYENVTPGTQLDLHGFVAHYRKTKERPKNLTFKILHESDKERHFDIGQQDGVLRVAKALDREKIAEYKLVIEARDLGGNSGNTSAVIEVLDVNDNAPILHPVNGFSVDENGKVPSFVGIITATDADGPNNRDPFRMEYVGKGPLSNAFELTFDQNLDNGRGGMKVAALQSLDREGPYGKEIFLPIKVTDSGSPPMSAVRNFRIEIGDVNDNPMTDGQSTIYVFDYEGHLPPTLIGRAFVEDLDDWDYEDKIFSMVNGPASFFSVEHNGFIRMERGTEPGVYNIIVSVNDRRRDENASANVTIILERLNDDAVQNSGSFIIKGMNPEEFLASNRFPKNSPSPYQTMRRNLAHLLNIPEDRVQIFSVKSYWPEDYDAQMLNEKFTEVHFAAYNSPYMSSVYLNGILQVAKKTLEKQLDPQGVINIVQINVDPCANEKYCATGGCVKRFRIGKEPILINSNRTSLLGVNLTVEAQCVCRNPSVPQRCVREACGNGGICHNVRKSNQTIGFFCECRTSGRGPRCEGKSRSFGPGGYVWLKPIASCDNFTISFEFATRSSNAVLLYNGPMTAQEPDQIKSIDLILVQIIAGRLTVFVNLGSGMKKFQLNNTQAPTVNDGDWHTVHIFLQRGARVVTVLLDKCQQDTRQCQVSGPTFGSNEQINVDTPLQLGGVAKVDGTPAPMENSESLDGCIRNLYIGGELYDLINVLKSESSEPGCKHTESYCDTNAFQGPRFNSLCHEGECVASFNGDARCVCDVGWTGDRCEKQSYWKTFKKGAYVNYSLKKLELLSKSGTKVRLMFVRGGDDESDDGQLFRIQDTQGTKSSIINLQSRRVGYEFSTSTPGESYEVRPLSPLHANVPYTVDLDRFWSYTSVSVDGSPDARYAAHRLPEEYHIYAVSNVQSSLVDYDPHKFLLGHGNSMKAGQVGVRNVEEFNGCIRELVFNDHHFEIGDSNDVAAVQSEHNVEDDCKFIASCKSGLVACRYPMICQDFWKGGFCTCPSNAKPIWHRSGDGTLEGCQESTAALRLGITNGAVAAILISLLTLIVLVLILVVYSRRRRKPPSIQEDLISRENVRGYNEEGGGEEDQYNYNIGPLRKPVLPTEDWPQGTPIVSDSGRPKPKSHRPEGDLDTFIRDRLRDARRDPMAPPFDELRSYGVEKDNLDRISLSSLSTDGESDIDQDVVRSWGPKFARIADAYGHN